MPSRRRFIAGLGAVGLAGCLSAPSGSDSKTTTRTTNSTTTRTTSSTAETVSMPRYVPWGERVDVAEHTIEPETAWVQHSTMYMETPDTLGVADFGNRQTLFVSLSVVSEDPPSPSRFGVRAGSDYQPITEFDGTGGFSIAPDQGGRGRMYTPEDSSGWISTKLPTAIGSETPRLTFAPEGVHGMVQWDLPEPVNGRLRQQPPDFSVDTVELPSSVPSGQPFTVSMTVRNDGGPAPFRMVVNEHGPNAYVPHTAIEAIQGDATSAVAIEVDPYGSEPGDELSMQLVTVPMEREFTVTVTE